MMTIGEVKKEMERIRRQNFKRMIWKEDAPYFYDWQKDLIGSHAIARANGKSNIEIEKFANEIIYKEMVEVYKKLTEERKMRQANIDSDAFMKLMAEDI